MEYIFLPLFRFKIGRKLWSVLFEFNAFYLRSSNQRRKPRNPSFFFGKKLPNALAGLALNQFKK